MKRLFAAAFLLLFAVTLTVVSTRSVARSLEKLQEQAQRMIETPTQAASEQLWRIWEEEKKSLTRWLGSETLRDISGRIADLRAAANDPAEIRRAARALAAALSP